MFLLKNILFIKKQNFIKIFLYCLMAFVRNDRLLKKSEKQKDKVGIKEWFRIFY